MNEIRRLPPVWLLGMCNLPQSVFGAAMLVTVPQLLAANNVPEPRIASVIAIGLAPGFCGFVLAPILDWRFSRRFYALLFAGLTAILLFAALSFVKNLKLLSLLLFLGMTASQLYAAAIGGWLGTLTATEDKSRLGAWLAVATIAGGGVTAIVAIFLLRQLPYAMGAGLLSLLLLTPLSIFAWLPAPPADRKLARESFRDFSRDVLALSRKRSVVWTLILFILPAASFSLTNTLGGLGGDFGASEQLVGTISGAGATIAGIIGGLLVPQLVRWMSPRPLYLAIGIFGASFTLTLVALPHSPATFALAMLGENIFQAAAFAVENVIILRAIGNDNPLAATQFAILNAATSLPIAYMQVIDGYAYGEHGLLGSYCADGIISLTACAALATILWFGRRRISSIEGITNEAQRINS